MPSSRAESVKKTQVGFNRSLSNLLVLRGKDVCSADTGKDASYLILSFGYCIH